METKQLLNIKISLGPYKSFVELLIGLAGREISEYVCVANVHMLIEAYKDNSYLSIVNNGVMVTPDGEPLTWGLKFLYGIRQERVAGMDLLPDLLAAAEKQNTSVGFYGSTEDLLKRTNEHLKKKYPKLQVAKLYSPPFRMMTPEEDFEIIKMFNESGARIIFVILGCPKQEKWMASMKDRIHAVMIGVGGALPVLIGVQKRAPLWMQHAGLEWLFRLGQEPRRLFKRYTTTNSMFIYLLIKQKILLRKYTSLKS